MGDYSVRMDRLGRDSLRTSRAWMGSQNDDVVLEK